MDAYDENVDRENDLVLSPMLHTIGDLFATAENRLRETGATPIALADCHEMGQHVEREAIQNLTRALTLSLEGSYLRILHDMVDVSRNMLTHVSTLEECGIVLNWMSSLAIRSMGFTMERGHIG